MGWGNGQVDYGASPIYGGGVVYEDTRTIKELQRQLDKAVRFFEEMFISNRAWTLVAYTVANSENREKRSKDELNALHKKAESILIKYVKKNGFPKFYKNVPPVVMLEP